jgi:Fic family protein
MTYNWQQPDWPDFEYQLEEVEDILYAFAQETGHVTGLLKSMPEESQLSAIINMMIAEAINTSAIEGEFLSRQDVMSSIRNKMGLHASVPPAKDKRSQGAGELMVAVRNSYAAPLSEHMLFSWHETLMKGNRNVSAGAWRSLSEPMQVISGAYGDFKVHFEAPPSSAVPRQMKKFIKWFNNTAPGGRFEIKKAPVRSAIAHLYFETIHPFEDGNGRIGRAIAEKALSQTIGRPVVLSLSYAIEADRAAYYHALKTAQRTMEITEWLKYFTAIILQAQVQAKTMIDFTLRKAKLFDSLKDQLNERQLRALTKMTDAGPEEFEGGMNASKYMSITRTSKATATRDLQALVELKALLPVGGGRSTRYTLNI